MRPSTTAAIRFLPADRAGWLADLVPAWRRQYGAGAVAGHAAVLLLRRRGVDVAGDLAQLSWTAPGGVLLPSGSRGVLQRIDTV